MRNVSEAELDALIDLAKVQYSYGFVVKAERILKLVYWLAPDNVDAQLMLAQCEVDAHSFDKAIDRLANLLRLDPGNQAALKLIGKAALMNGDKEMAEDYLMQLPNSESVAD